MGGRWASIEYDRKAGFNRGRKGGRVGEGDGEKTYDIAVESISNALASRTTRQEKI